MNLLYLTQFFSATKGGGEVIFYNYAEGMARRGHKVFVVCHESNNVSENDIRGVVIKRIRPVVEHRGGLPPSMRHNLLYIVNAVRIASKLIKQHQIDLIHTNNFSPTIAGSILSKLHKVPMVNTVHDVFTGSIPNYWRSWATQNDVSRISSYIGPLFERLTLKVPTNIIHTVSSASRNDLLNLRVRSAIMVIYNGLDLNEYNKLLSAIEYQKYVVFIGRLVFYKNLEVVISSFKKVVEEINVAKLIIIGDGPKRKDWENMVNRLNLTDNVEFLGYVSQEKKLDLLMHASALVLPSLVEGFGLVLLESFALKKPVLVSDVEPFNEIVSNGEDGYMLPAKDATRWSEMLIRLLSHPETCEKMGEMGRKKVETQFAIDKVIDKMESLYMELHSKQKSI
jgi:glycosyltransferase involved in cell wall biosynthesis